MLQTLEQMPRNEIPIVTSIYRWGFLALGYLLKPQIIRNRQSGKTNRVWYR